MSMMATENNLLKIDGAVRRETLRQMQAAFTEEAYPKPLIKKWKGMDWAGHSRAVFKRRAVQHINVLDIFIRDKWICHVCGKPVDLDDASLDHVIAIANGGSHTPDNVRCAHQSCNLERWITRESKVYRAR